MNSANQPPAPHRPSDEQLEERIVAWVLGEASDFEIAALQAAVAARPELATFKRRIEAVHGLVAEAARPEAAPLRLSPDRRAKLLAAIGSASVESKDPDPGEPIVAPKPAATRQRSFWAQDWVYSVAACLAFAAVLLAIPLKEKLHGPVAMKAIPLEMPSAACSMPGADGYEEESAKLAEPMNTVGVSDITTVIKPAPPITNKWTPPATKSTRSLSVQPNSALGMTYGMKAPGATAARAASSVLPRREVEVASARGWSGTTDDGSTGVLDKFEVSADADVGYAATSTLAGTRVRTELKDLGSSISVVSGEMLEDRGVGARGSFLSKGKAERSGGKGGSPAPAAPAVGGEAEEIVVLSPFEVTQDKSFLRGNRPTKKPKRPDPSATTAGMGPGGLVASDSTLGSESDQPVITVEEPAPAAADTDRPLPRPAQKPLPPPTADETSAAQEPVSTFSLHVSDASFKLALAALAAGKVPDPTSIRPEEFYNAFDYGDPAPGAGEKVSCRVEQAAHPFAQQRNLVRIAVRVPATGRGAGTPLNLTVLLDTSGSMERPDRRAAVRAALSTLVGLLGPADRLTLVGFARQPRLLAEAIDGAHANQALELLDRTPAEGGTNLEEALRLGGELARRHFADTAQNRIVLLTDGAANLGNADPERLAAAIETLRSQRIAFDACGVGLEGVEDEMLEALTRKGDGRYYVLDSPEAADAGFARQLAGAFRPAAENVKLQVRFNPARVGRYRLVGFEKHRLREEDFRNDAVDAAEISSEEAAVAVYEIEALPQGEGELGEVFVRFRDAASKTMVEHSWTLPYESRAAAFDRASPSLQLAGTAAALAEKLRGGPAGDRVDIDQLAPIVNTLRARRPDDKRIQDLVTLFEQMRRMKGR